nr:uncharacterized protein LOC123771260 [Procambarus clarkii]
MIALFLLSVVTCGCVGQTLIDPIPRPCRSLGSPVSWQARPSDKHNEYPSGGLLMALASIPSGVEGVFEFYLCPEEVNSQEEECLERLPLQLADGSGTTFNLSTVTRADKYEIPIVLPDDTTCELCTLQWHLVMKECEDEDCTIVDRVFCSDVTIREAKDSEKRVFGLLFNIIGGMFRKMTDQ